MSIAQWLLLMSLLLCKSFRRDVATNYQSGKLARAQLRRQPRGASRTLHAPECMFMRFNASPVVGLRRPFLSNPPSCHIQGREFGAVLAAETNSPELAPHPQLQLHDVTEGHFEKEKKPFKIRKLACQSMLYHSRTSPRPNSPKMRS